MQKNILVVENDQLLCQSLTVHCKKKDYLVTTTPSLSQAYTALENTRFDLAIVDRGLDDGDGIEVVEYLHDCSPNTRILVCSKLGEHMDRVHALSQGADTCISKPFTFSELSLKIERLLSLERKQRTEVLTAGILNLYPQSGTVLINNHRFFLRKRECEVLGCLLQYKNQVVSRDRLISTIWGPIDDTPEYGTLDVYIRRIRMKLKSYGTAIKTVRGYGYQVCDLEE